MAKKLLKTGAMKAIKKSLEKEKSKVELSRFVSLLLNITLYRKRKPTSGLRDLWASRGN